MSKILRQNVGGVDFTVVGCALTGVCPTSAADYVKQITLSDGDVIEDGMMMVVTFANGNSAGNAPGTRTIYSSDQVNYYEDAQLTVPFTLAPAGCYEIEYTGTANAYTYTDYPVFQVGSVSGPVCDYRGHITSGDLWNAGDSVQCMLKEGKFLLLGGSGGTDIDVYNNMAELIADLPNLQDGQFAATKDTGDELSQPVDTVEAGNLHAVTSNAVAEALSYSTTEVNTGAKWIDGKPIYRKVLTATLQTNEEVLNLTISAQIQSLVSVKGLLSKGSIDFVIPYCFIDGTFVFQIYTYCQGQDLFIIPRSSDGTYFTAGCVVKVIVEYTKTTD